MDPGPDKEFELMGGGFYVNRGASYAGAIDARPESLPGYMWDEIAGIAVIAPSILTGQKKFYMDIDIDHCASYGKTLFWSESTPVPPYERLANMQFDIDAEKFYKIYVDLMTRPPGKK